MSVKAKRSGEFFSKFYMLLGVSGGVHTRGKSKIPRASFEVWSGSFVLRISHGFRLGGRKNVCKINGLVKFFLNFICCWGTPLESLEEVIPKSEGSVFCSWPLRLKCEYPMGFWLSSKRGCWNKNREVNFFLNFICWWAGPLECTEEVIPKSEGSVFSYKLLYANCYSLDIHWIFIGYSDI